MSRPEDAIAGPREVRPGQVWEDMDPRALGRRLLVIGLKQGAALCRVIEAPGHEATVGQVRMIQPHRLRPWRNGYRLVEEREEP